MDPLPIPCANRLDTSDAKSKALHVAEELAPWEMGTTVYYGHAGFLSISGWTLMARPTACLDPSVGIDEVNEAKVLSIRVWDLGNRICSAAFRQVYDYLVLGPCGKGFPTDPRCDQQLIGGQRRLVRNQLVRS